MHLPEAWFLAAVLLPATLSGQELEGRVSAVTSGTLHLSFAARPGVCGDGVNNISTRRDDEEWESDCEKGPVRVTLRIRDHQVVALRTYVGGRWRQPAAATDLGTLRAQDAASYFIELAKSRRNIDGDPVLPATLADSVTVWPSLLRLARDPRLPSERRRNAIFWLGQAAEAAAGLALDSVASDPHGDREVRKQAVFALSQRDPAESVPRLIHIVKTNRDPELRKTALFWLGQSEDPRALELFEEILQ